MFHLKTNKKVLWFLFFFLLIAGGFSFVKTPGAQAGYCVYADATKQGLQGKSVPSDSKDNCEKGTSVCNNDPTAVPYTKDCKYYDNSTDAQNALAALNKTNTSINTTNKSGTGMEVDTCNFLTHPLVCTLSAILGLMAFLLRVAATLFNWVINPTNMNAVLTNDVIYTTWALVRDTLNVFFILVLLFSAFSTVFQIDKYSYKKILLRLVLMALLVNFSYPITRFIIDFSNSLMYYLLNSSGLGINNVNSAFPDIASSSQLANIVGTKSTSLVYLLMAVIFTWMLAITLLIIAGLFVIRIVVLALLIIFSALAFTGSIIPFTASYASKWWDNLFKYAFFGPVMVFMLGISVQMMSKLSTDGMLGNMKDVAGQQSVDPTFLSSVCFFILPIIILWGGIMFAQSMSLAGAGAVIGRGQKFMKWAPSVIAGATGVPGGVRKAKDYYGKKGAPGFFGKIPGLRGSEKTEATEDKISGFLTKGKKGWKTASIEKEKKDIAETRKKWKDNGGATESDITNALKSSDLSLRRAAAIEAAEKTGFGSTDTVAKDNYEKALRAVSGNKELESNFNGKVKEKHVRLAVEHDMHNGVAANTAYHNHLSKLTPEEFAKQKGLHEKIGTNPDLQNFIISEIAPDDEYHKEFFKKLTRAQRQAYIDLGLHP